MPQAGVLGCYVSCRALTWIRSIGRLNPENRKDQEERWNPGCARRLLIGIDGETQGACGLKSGSKSTINDYGLALIPRKPATDLEPGEIPLSLR